MNKTKRILLAAFLFAVSATGAAYLAGARVHFTAQVYSVVVEPMGATPPTMGEVRDTLAAIPGVIRVSSVRAARAGAGVRLAECRGTSALQPTAIQAAFAPPYRAYVREAQIGLLEVDWSGVGQ